MTRKKFLNWRSRCKVWRSKLDRPYKLLAVIVTVIVAVPILEHYFAADDMLWLRDWINDSNIFGALVFPDSNAIEWKDRLQGVLLLLGLPVAFCLWHWRDKNVREQIENSRKDINLKEFQEVQLRAAGAFNNDINDAAQQTLQIASLHQLRSFLKGDYGDSFKLPAFELYCALLARPSEAQSAVGMPRSVFDALRQIVAIEWKAFFRASFPLSNRCFDDVEFFAGTDLSNLQMSDSTFRRSRFMGVRLVASNLSQCDFQSAKFDFCDFKDAQLFQCKFEKAKISASRFSGACLKEADPQKMSWLISCEYSERTEFGRPNDEVQLGDEDISNSDAKALWLAKGLKLADPVNEAMWEMRSWV